MDTKIRPIYMQSTRNPLQTERYIYTESEKIEIISSIFSDHNAMRLRINYKKKTVKNTNT